MTATAERAEGRAAAAIAGRDRAVSRPDLPALRRALPSLLLALSGFAALCDQIVWTETCAMGLGHELSATLAVVTAFFGGLAVGACASAWLLRRGDARLWFAGCEVLIGSWAWVLSYALRPLDEALSRVLGLSLSWPWQMLALGLGTFFLLLPATAAMGVTLPAMARAVQVDGRHAGPGRLSGLYAANTAGAVLGVLTRAFFVIPALGAGRTARLSAAVSMVGGLLALMLLRRGGGPSTVEACRPSARAAWGSYAKFAALGFLGVGYQVLVVRVLAQVTESTVYTFAALLALDLDGNGTLDLVAADQASMGTVSVALGMGNGTFAAKVDTPVESGPHALATADINGDGKHDILAVNTGSDSVSVLLGNGSAMFPSSYSLKAGTTPSGVTVGDFNNDGKPDLAVSNSGSNDVSVLINLGTTFAAAVAYPAGTAPLGITSGDFNNDGAIDLAVVDSGSAQAAVLFGTGTGTFGMPVSYNIGNSPAGILAIDLNGDGNVDLVTADHGGKDVTALVNTGIGTFADVLYPIGSPPNAIVAADVNGDGKLDVATSNDDGSATVLLGYAGELGAPDTFDVGPTPSGVALGDFNTDGKIDVAVANTSLASALVVQQTQCL